MTGLAPLLRTQWRTSRRTVLVWVLALVGSLAATAVSIARLYDTPAKVSTYAEAVVSDALVAINGRVEGIETLGGIVQDEFGFMASFLMPLLGIALVARLTRREEESGRLEHLLAGRVDRRAPVVGALVVVLGAVLVTVAGFALSMVLAGVPTSGALLYALALGALTLAFAGLAALAAQVVLHSRGVYSLGLAVVAASYVLRGVGDVTGTAWVWLSPLGWVEKAAPFGPQQRWWVLAVPLAVGLLAAVAAVGLAARRDVGSALHRPGPGPARASRVLLHPVGLAAHVQRGSFVGWLVGSAVLAGVMGALAQQVVDAVAGNPALAEFMTGTGAGAAEGFLAVTEVYLAVLACGYVVQALGTMRHEEAGGRLEPVLAGTLPRWRWLGAQLLVVGGGLVVIVLVSALVFGGTTAVSTGSSGYVGTLVAAGFAYLPAELVLAGLAVALFGLAPRGYALAWAAVGAVTFVALLGAGLQMPPWLLDLAPTTHVGNPPQGDVQALPLLVLTLVAAVLGAVGFAAFRRRLVPQG